MIRFFNSLQIQLYIIVLLLTGLVVVEVVLNVTLIQAADSSISQADAASLQRSNAYLLASLARRFTNAEGERDIEGISQLLDDAIARAREIEDALRFGHATLDIVRIADPDVLLQLDALDTEWDEYLALLETLQLASDDDREAILTEIDQQSVTVFNFADRVVSLLNFKIEKQRERVQQVSKLIGVVTLFAIVAAIIIVTRIVRSVRQLSHTATILASGDLSARAAEGGLNETAQVGSAFNSMASRLDGLVGELETQVDVAEKARVTAEQSDQVKSAFLASMSHELRTPLNSVINFSKFVVRGIMGPVTDRQIETLNKVIASGQHLLSLINDVCWICLKLNQGHSHFSLKTISIPTKYWIQFSLVVRLSLPRNLLPSNWISQQICR
ncbi:MAG: histidine kinase dimerization/phospho-acceptor domain-containing protein [Anaerolineae bacterium]|nr:histidine kinase dimerization/phospho-acceptor domain-containing protein [Anaerolineae bacterium]